MHLLQDHLQWAPLIRNQEGGIMATKKHHPILSPLPPPPVESMPGATVSGSHSSDTLKTHASWGRGKENTPVQEIIVPWPDLQLKMSVSLRRAHL